MGRLHRLRLASDYDAGAFDGEDTDGGGGLYEFASGDDVENGFAETSVAAGTQDRKGDAVCAHGEGGGRIDGARGERRPARLFARKRDEAKEGGLGEICGEEWDGDGGQDDGDAELRERPLEHGTGGHQGLVRIAVDHRPKHGGADEKQADEAGDDGAGVDDDFAHDEAEADGEDDGDFPAGEAGDIAAEEEEQEADRRDKSRRAETADLELDIDADDAAEQQKRCEGGKPEGEGLEPGGLDVADGTIEAGLRE